MAFDLLLNLYKKDPTVKRHLLKSITWRLVGSIDTVVIGTIVTGKPAIGLQIGGIELLTKILLYFFHERLWVRVRYGLPFVLSRHKPENRKAENLFRQYFTIDRKKREELMGHPAFTIWMTGLSASGKSTLALALDEWFHHRGIHSYILDGDNTRLHLNRDLDFSREGRKENIRRVAESARLFNDAGVIVIASFISPYAEDRLQASEIIGKKSFVEVHVSASVKECMQRDVKGLYKKAMEGKINDFTGVNSPYEPPVNPSILIETGSATIHESLGQITTWIAENLLVTDLRQIH